MQKKTVGLIGGMHFALDTYMSFFAVYLVIAGLDPVRAALIATVTSFVGNILQPFMGYTADRLRGKLPLFTGLLLTSIFMSAVGLTKNYTLLFFLVLLGTLGSSIFHPAGANVAGGASERKKDASFAIFSTLGTVGYALSQPIFSFFTGQFGNTRSIFLASPTVLLAFIYLVFSRVEIHGNEEPVHFDELKRVFLKRRLPILLLFFIMVFRSAFVMTMNVFLAKTFEEWGFSRGLYSSANAVFMLCGALSILLAGYLAAWIKPRRLLFISLVGFLPFFFLFLFFGRSQNTLPAFVFLALTGFVLNGGHAANIVMGHRIAPEMTSTISGVLMGFAWAVASFGPTFCALLSGSLKALPGLSSGLLILTAFPLSAAVLALFLSHEVDS
jgi:FSR family fosmidomycin resistance protein-like MFS transporter